ncbi:hypothetical protein [Pandoravirus japonicus]|uniref:Uncharacterized protein n=1 Tax=Pandoravirus japonicus TaxID=2823154 RepID=A0A811BNC5_9VIRU|nr:hypothetical protein [Pandoravirus japonicus]
MVEDHGLLYWRVINKAGIIFSIFTDRVHLMGIPIPFFLYILRAMFVVEIARAAQKNTDWPWNGMAENFGGDVGQRRAPKSWVLLPFGS